MVTTLKSIRDVIQKQASSARSGEEVMATHEKVGALGANIFERVLKFGGELAAEGIPVSTSSVAMWKDMGYYYGQARSEGKSKEESVKEAFSHFGSLGAAEDPPPFFSEVKAHIYFKAISGDSELYGAKNKAHIWRSPRLQDVLGEFTPSAGEAFLSQETIPDTPAEFVRRVLAHITPKFDGVSLSFEPLRSGRWAVVGKSFSVDKGQEVKRNLILENISVRFTYGMHPFLLTTQANSRYKAISVDGKWGVDLLARKNRSKADSDVLPPEVKNNGRAYFNYTKKSRGSWDTGKYFLLNLWRQTQNGTIEDMVAIFEWMGSPEFARLINQPPWG